MLKFTLAVSYLTVSSLIWFMNLTFQVPVQYCSLQHWTLLSPPNISTAERCFHFGPATSFFPELLVTVISSSPVAYWTPSNLGAHLLASYLFAFSCCPWGSPGKNSGVGCHFLLQWTRFCQNSSLWPIRLGWPDAAWLIASLSYASPFGHDKAAIHEGG